MAMVPMMVIGMTRSGRGTSSARWVAESRQEKAQLGLMRPTMKAIAPDSQPVSLVNVANTNLASCLGDALARTVMVMTAKETREHQRPAAPIFGRALPQQLKVHATPLKIM